jgi:hypothetical protein
MRVGLHAIAYLKIDATKSVVMIPLHTLTVEHDRTKYTGGTELKSSMYPKFQYRYDFSGTELAEFVA